MESEKRTLNSSLVLAAFRDSQGTFAFFQPIAPRADRRIPFPVHVLEGAEAALSLPRICHQQVDGADAEVP